MALNVLRAVLFVIGLGLLSGAAALALAGCGPGALWFSFLGLVLIGAALIERWRYKRLAASRPGPEWVATEERFIDPESGRLVTVYYHRATGERRYVAG